MHVCKQARDCDMKFVYKNPYLVICLVTDDTFIRNILFA